MALVVLAMVVVVVGLLVGGIVLMVRAERTACVGVVLWADRV